MSNRYFNFLADLFVKWFSNREIAAGSRYQLTLDSQNQVDQLYDALSNVTTNASINVRIFDMQPDGLNFQAKVLTVDQNELVIVRNADNITMDFLVTLRNRVGDQEGIWRGKSIVFLSSSVLDSITGGAVDISSDGGPFNSNKLAREVSSEISRSNMRPFEVSALEQVAAEFEDPQFDFKLMDFADIYGILEQGEITSADFPKLGLFADEQLAGINDSKTQKMRLEKNHELFQKIADIHAMPGVEEAIDDLLPTLPSNRKKQLLNDDEWADAKFEPILQADTKQRDARKVYAEFDSDQFDAQKTTGITVWRRPEGTTKAKLRTHNIIVFVDQQNSDVAPIIELPFTSNVREGDITKEINYDGVRGAHIFERRAHGRRLKITVRLPREKNVAATKLTFEQNGVAASKNVFKILAVRAPEQDFLSIKSQYTLTVKIKAIVVNVFEVQTALTFSTGETVQTAINNSTQLNRRFAIDDGYSYDFNNYKFDDDEAIMFPLAIGTEAVDIKLATEQVKPVPRSAMMIDIERRTSMENVVVNGVQQLSIGNSLVYTRKEQQRYLELERDVLISNTFYIDISNGESKSVDLDLPDVIIAKIQAVRRAVQDAGTLPSLSVVGDNPVSNALVEYYQAVAAVIDGIENDSMLSPMIQNLAKLGTVRRNDSVYYSPLAPINVMYFQITEAQIGNERLSRNVNHRLSTDRLVPYLQFGEEMLESSIDDNAPHWVMYNPIKTTGTDSDIADLVSSRIYNFLENFSYLFKVNRQFALHVAVKNITDHKYIVIGAINALIEKITKFADKARRSNDSRGVPTLDDLHPIQIYFAGDDKDSDVDNNQLVREFFNAQTLDQLVNLGVQQLKTSVINQFSDRDILLALQRNIQIYNKIDPKLDYHITFYEFAKQSSPTVISADKLKMNTALGGILASSEYTQMRGWGVGFGTMGNPDVNEYPITSFAAKWNALVAATKTGNDSFELGKTIVNYESKLDDSSLEDDFDSSDWVTFIEPRLDLDAFNTLKDLYVIHYTDKNVTSNVDSITVTKRVDRYNQIIREMLDKQAERYENFPVPTTESLAQVISAFNLLNGVWLLRILNTHQSNPNIVREKLSAIAAYKMVIGVLDTKDTYWIPISLEELLRITGGSGLSKQDSMLSGSQLADLKSASDDILMMGAQIGDKGDITMRILPVEVKVGENSAGVLTKAKSQVANTIRFLNQAVLETDSFSGRVFRDFFVTLYLNNLSKMESSGVYQSKDYSAVEALKNQLKNEQVKFVNDAGNEFGNGLIVSFKQDVIYRNFELLSVDDEHNVTKIEVPESDAYAVPGQSLDTVVADIKHGKAGFETSRIPEYLESAEIDESKWTSLKKKSVVVVPTHRAEDLRRNVNTFQSNSVSVVGETVAKMPRMTDSDKSTVKDDSESQILQSNEQYQQGKSDVKESVITDTTQKEVGANTNSNDPEVTHGLNVNAVSLPLGRIAGGTQTINWEYGNRELSNRHMLVSGKSGQGKTYFMQGLLLEMANQNVSTLVIDYSDSYRIDQLDPMFVERMGDRIVNHIVAVDGMALNPFKRVSIDYGGGMVLPEDIGTTAERVAQTLDFVFDLGTQQHSALVDYIAEGIETYGDNYGFEQLKAKIKEDKANTLYGRLQPLLNSPVFRKSDKQFDWADYFKNDGTMNIIQLMSIPRRVQNAVTEFLLWDLFHYAQSSGGDESQPLPIFLDEVQNLSFDRDSPAVKILREGRKFGISGIFATQSIASINGSDRDSIWNAAMQMHFLPPEDQVVMLSKSVTADKSERDMIEQKLRNLQKGHALLRGPVMGPNGLTQQVNEIKILQIDER
ncbi:helicase HerA domain-containing protein [Lacticaseibacillus songhuajiangensis]|uniref:helicase HerA domain-containing protein n=1 Tax=Lacticaseibacillus songhuajiangensis TaxID=1296539 RepID=UPI0013DE50C2|nr:DUF87 domain-containing protein [Lacticaseibacillus songhuajiangensis]